MRRERSCYLFAWQIDNNSADQEETSEGFNGLKGRGDRHIRGVGVGSGCGMGACREAGARKNTKHDNSNKVFFSSPNFAHLLFLECDATVTSINK